MRNIFTNGLVGPGEFSVKHTAADLARAGLDINLQIISSECLKPTYKKVQPNKESK